MKQLLTLLVCISSFATFGQSINVAYSEPFDEPEALDNKVVQCPNGNTFLFSFTKKEGIEVMVYDKSHKLVATQKLIGGPGSWSPENMSGNMFGVVSKGSKICAIYPLGDEIVMFLEQISDRTPRLYRIRLSNTDGKLKKEEVISEMTPFVSGGGTNLKLRLEKDFFVERDLTTGSYAVLRFDAQAPETDKRIELTHYDAAHQETGRSFFESPETHFKYAKYLGMVVMGNDRVQLATYCYNAEGGGGISKVFVSEQKGPSFTHHPIDYTANLKNMKGLLIYNPVTKMLELFTLSEGTVEASGGIISGTKIRYIMRQTFVIIDPVTYAVVNNISPVSQMMTRYRKQKYDQDEERYTGIPVDLIINPDGTNTLVYEDERPAAGGNGGIMDNMIAKEIAKKNNIFMAGETPVSSNMLLDIGITEFDAQGVEKNGYVVRKSQHIKAIIPPMSHIDTRNNRVSFDQKIGLNLEANTGYYSFDYISTPSGRFAIFNDHPKNFERDAEKSPVTLERISDANTICYRLSGGEMSKFYFFGEPNDHFDNRIALITSGDYSDITGDYAVLMIEKTGRRTKQARIAWAHLK